MPVIWSSDLQQLSTLVQLLEVEAERLSESGRLALGMLREGLDSHIEPLRSARLLDAT